MVMVPFFIWTLGMHTFNGYALSLLLFVLAALTDHFDGILARKYGQVTNLGKFFDPLSDKILVLSAFIYFIRIDFLAIPSWMLVLIMTREFIITGLRSLAAMKGEIVAALFSGKVKTTIQMTTIIYILLFLTVRTGFSGSLPQGVMNVMERLPLWLMSLVTLATIYSGISYLAQYRRFLRE